MKQLAQMNQLSTMINRLIASKNAHFWIYFTLLVLLAIFTMWSMQPFSEQGDFHFHQMRIEALVKALADGSYPSYLDYDAARDYGYMTKFYPDLLLIPFAYLAMFTDTMFAYHSLIFTLIILSGIFTYHAVNVIYKSTYTAALGGIVYTFAVYHVFNLFDRAALGEAMAMSFFPLVLWGLYHIIKGDYKRKWYILTIAFSLIIHSHAISSLLIFLFTVALLLFYIKPMLREPKRILYLMLAALVTVVIIAHYALPLLEQTSSINFYFKDRPIILPHTRRLPFAVWIWGFISGAKYFPGMTFCGVGIILTVLVSLRLFIRKRGSEALKSVDFMVLMGLVCILSTLSFVPWGRFPFTLLQAIQFPWRLYGYSTLFFAVGGAYYLALLVRTRQARIVVFIGVLLATTATVYMHGENFKGLMAQGIGKWHGPVAPNSFYHLTGAEYMPTKVPGSDYIEERRDKITFKNADTRILSQEKTPNLFVFDVAVTRPDSLELPLTYYIGYESYMGDRRLPMAEGANGLVQVYVEQSGSVQTYYAGTTLQRVGFYITLIGILGLAIYIFFSSRKKQIG